MPPKPRPRPRLVMKKAVPCDPNVDASSTFSHISDLPISATRRTIDSIHPATATSVGFSDAVDDVYSFDIAERAKMRSRKSQTAKRSIQPQVTMNEVIELTSDEDELGLTLKPTKRQKKQNDPITKSKVQTRPRPKPRLKAKPAVVLPSGSPTSQTVIRDLPAPLPQCASSSQLPASTLPTIPPSTPPQPREPTPLSSPLVTTRKRKRIRPSVAEDDDEMDIISRNPTEVSPSFTMPPPFFAPSSSSLPTDSGIEIPLVEPLSGRGKKKQVSSGKKGTQKKAPTKGKKGKKGNMTSAVDEMAEDSTMLSREPSTPAIHHIPSFTKERYSPVVRNTTASRSPSSQSAMKKASVKQAETKKGKARAIDSCEEEDELILPSKSNTAHTPILDEGDGQRSKVH